MDAGTYRIHGCLFKTENIAEGEAERLDLTDVPILLEDDDARIGRITETHVADGFLKITAEIELREPTDRLALDPRWAVHSKKRRTITGVYLCAQGLYSYTAVTGWEPLTSLI